MPRLVAIKRDHGERNCTTCGEPHDLWEYPTRAAPFSWASRRDGHPYRPESWETVARRLLGERGA